MKNNKTQLQKISILIALLCCIIGCNTHSTGLHHYTQKGNQCRVRKSLHTTSPENLESQSDELSNTDPNSQQETCINMTSEPLIRPEPRILIHEQEKSWFQTLCDIPSPLLIPYCIFLLDAIISWGTYLTHQGNQADEIYIRGLSIRNALSDSFGIQATSTLISDWRFGRETPYGKWDLFRGVAFLSGSIMSAYSLLFPPQPTLYQGEDLNLDTGSHFLTNLYNLKFICFTISSIIATTGLSVKDFLLYLRSRRGHPRNEEQRERPIHRQNNSKE